MRVAAIDCGTNSLRLLVADAVPDAAKADAGPDPDAGGAVLPVPAVREVDRRTRIVRLGAGVDATGRLAPEALARAAAVVAEYAAVCDQLGVDRVRVVATSASRDARNAADFVAEVRAAFAPRLVVPEVLDGAREAELSFLGAAAAVVAAGHPGPYVVVDLGGGSTEFVRGHVAGGAARVEAATSVDLGSVRLTERHLRSDPPTREEVAAALADIEARLDEAARAVPFAGVGTLVGVAGTVTTLTAHALRLPRYDRGRVHLATPGPDTLIAACADLLGRPVAARAALPFMPAGRADVIGAGALAWAAILRRFTTGLKPAPRVVTCEHDILDGVAIELAR